MERPKTISKRITSDLPTSEELGKMTFEQRIELGKNHVEEKKQIEIAKLRIDSRLQERKDLSLEQKAKLRQELYKQAEENIHKKIFEK